MGEVDDIIAKINPRYSKAPIWENSITYDTATGTLQPLYYWIVDFMGGYKPEKIVDSFTASPGSSYFADLGTRATRMQEEGMKILGSVNTVVQSIIRVLYDLKDFDLRLQKYDQFHKKNSKEKERGLLGLKEVWMNNVDAQRGMGGINNLANQVGFTLLRPAFMSAKSADSVDKMDLNETVKNILKPRVSEFFYWIELSEKELRKRYELQRGYLQSQVAALELYSRWVKPYLKAAEQLRMKENTEPSLVSVFGSMILELELFGKKKIDIAEEAKAKNLPPYFKKVKGRIRDFWQVITVNFKFRTYPTPQAQHTGKVDISFKAYALNDDEMLLFEKLREGETIDGALKVSESLTGITLAQLKEDIAKYTEEHSKEDGEEGNLFTGLFDEITKIFVKPSKRKIDLEEKKKEKEKKEKEERKNKLLKEGIEEDNYEEGIVREYAEIQAAEFSFKTYDIFKKSQGMASFASPFDDPEKIKRFRAKRAEIKALMQK